MDVKMRKLIYLVLILSLFFFCGPKLDKVERIFEDGVEVVINHVEPYVIDDESKILKAERKVLMDFESEEISKLGISDIRGFDIDSEGNIFMSVFRGEYCIYKFDKNGKFLTSFARKGQGPGELSRIARSLSINDKDEISTYDSSKQNFLVFDGEGNLLKEIPLPYRINRIFPLRNGNFLLAKFSGQRRSPFYYSVILALCDSGLREIKSLEELKIPNGPGASYWIAFGDRIYVGSEERDYEIWIYDLEGNLIRKIRKEYKPVPIPDEIRVGWKKAYEKLRQQTGTREEIEIRKSWPPYFAFFIDSEERLYVRTFEEGENKDEYIHDVFSSDGVFIGRISLNLSFDRGYKYVKSSEQNIYGFLEKESGYEELVVYKINWE